MRARAEVVLQVVAMIAVLARRFAQVTIDTLVENATRTAVMIGASQPIAEPIIAEVMVPRIARTPIPPEETGLATMWAAPAALVLIRLQ